MPIPPPWKSGFALPSYISTRENIERGAKVTAQTRRGSFFGARAGVYTSGYALPQYVEDEPMGQGTFVTKQLARGTGYPKKVPGSPSSFGSLGSLGGSSLGDDAPVLRRSKDPFLKYGKDAAATIMRGVERLPAGEPRKKALRIVLDGIDPTLWATVEKKATEFQAKKGYSAKIALHRALAASLANGMSRGVVELGLKQRYGTQALGATPAVRDNRATGGEIVTAADGSVRRCVQPGAPTRVPGTTTMRQGPCRKWETIKKKDGGGGFFDSVVNTVSDTVNSVVDGVKTVISYTPPGLAYQAGKSVISHADDIANAAKTAVQYGTPIGLATTAATHAGDIADAAGDILNKVGSAACDVLSSGIAPAAGAAVAGAYGAPPQVGAIGGAAAAGLCGQKLPPPPPPVFFGSSFPIVPVLIAGVGVIGLVIVLSGDEHKGRHT